jgi:hypothetical protein
VNYCVQLDAIIRTVSTFSFGAFAELDIEPELAELLEVEPAVLGLLGLLDDEFSSVPVISTLWPTCALSLESSASSL